MEGKARQLYADNYVKPYLVLKSIKHPYPTYKVDTADLENEIYGSNENTIYKGDRHNLLDKVYGSDRDEELDKVYKQNEDIVLDKLHKVNRGKLKQITDILQSESRPVSIEDCCRNQDRNKNRECKKIKTGNEREKFDLSVSRGIYKIITTLDQINNNIAKMVALYKNQTVKQTQTTTKKARKKREVSFTTEAEKTAKKTTETNPKITAEALLNNKNNTQEDSVMEKTTETPNLSGRRSYKPSTVDIKSSVKNKLLSYLDATYNDIVNKIAPLQMLKQEFSDNDAYKIGYLIANVDTLAVNINKLKQDIDANKDFWDDKKILELFHKLMESHKIVTNLIDSLNGYVERTALKSQVSQRFTFI